jgi:outer membrane lipoprotein-sorting protein
VTAGGRRAAAAALVLPLLLLAGCRFTTRKLPVPRAPLVTQTVTPADLVSRLSQRCDALKTLNATVEIQASVMKSKEGVARDYTSFRGHILMRKPEMLRVYGQIPVIGTTMFDMASDGKNFTLRVPSRNIAYQGPNTLTHKSSNAVENMRPGFFIDAMVIRCMEPDDEYMVTADTDTVEDASKKHLLLVPEYILSVMRRKPGSQELRALRVIHFHRDDLLPYQQDVYDEQSNLETQVIYGRYADFGDNKYPSVVTIKRPLEDFQLVLTVEKVTENMQLNDDQFQIKIPEGTKIQQMQ